MNLLVKSLIITISAIFLLLSFAYIADIFRQAKTQEQLFLAETREYLNEARNSILRYCYEHFSDQKKTKASYDYCHQYYTKFDRVKEIMPQWRTEHEISSLNVQAIYYAAEPIIRGKSVVFFCMKINERFFAMSTLGVITELNDKTCNDFPVALITD